VEIMIPVWATPDAPEVATERPASLKDCQVAIIDDNYDPPFTMRLETLLREVHGAVVERFVKPLGSSPSPRSLIDSAAKYKVAVVGIGM
jgi:hypothetical protein